MTKRADASTLAAVGLDEARRLLGDLFDARFYRGEARLAADEDAFAHYFRKGGGLRPNHLFEPQWYVERNPHAASVNPLLHYAVLGEPADRDPSALFDVAWHRRTYAADRPLAHYLGHRFEAVSPIPEFDAAYYLHANPDVAAAGLDPFLHYLHFGYREYRKPSASFNPRLYANRWLANDRAANPLVHLRANKVGVAAAAQRAGLYEAVRRNSRRGLRFEALAPPVSGAPRARVLAFHLTQFHAIPENDAWWGEGFTEWTQLARGQPRFEGHYQPRIPERLGFYDLTDPDVLRAQAALARAAGVAGFVFYTYEFGGKRLLEAPLELFLGLPDIDIGFCLMWANENWTRRWDGAEDEVLIAQDYDEAGEARRCAEFARHFRDPRYVRLEGRPLLMVYRAGLIPNAAATMARWRRLYAALGETPVFVMAQTFDDLDPRALGFDAAVEFPPHKLTRGLPQIYDALEIHDEGFEADVFAYDDLVAASLSEPAPEYPLIKTAVPSWDNDARRQGKGLTLVGSTPGKYERWLSALVERARPAFGEKIVCVNAWNEWSEGAYLEPDVHFGAAYLNATLRAVYGLPAAKAAPVDAAKISAFVLHRGGSFPAQRLRSLLAQTYPVVEIVVLDEGENSLGAVEAEARAAERDVTLGLDVADGLGQAARMAGGDFVWIVDLHGRSDPGFLATLVAPLLADPRIVFAFCETAAVDADLRPVHVRPTIVAPPQRPASFADRVFEGAEYLARWGAAPSLSATLWRRTALAAAPDARALAAAPGARVYHVAEGLDLAGPAAG